AATSTSTIERLRAQVITGESKAAIGSLIFSFSSGWRSSKPPAAAESSSATAFLNISIASPIWSVFLLQSETESKSLSIPRGERPRRFLSRPGIVNLGALFAYATPQLRPAASGWHPAGLRHPVEHGPGSIWGPAPVL